MVTLVRYGTCLIVLAATAMVGIPASTASDPATVVFVAQTDYRRVHVFSADATGGNRINLTAAYNDMAAIDPPVWSPDGSRLMFAASELHPLFERNLFVLGTDRVRRRLTDNSWNVEPVWSPDGRRIAFVHWERGGAPDSMRLFVMDADGTDKRLVVDVPAGSADWSVRNRLVYSSSGELYTIDPDGSNRRHIGSGRLPAWSPDGRRLAFFRSERLWVANEDGTDSRQLSQRQAPQNHLAWPPAWSPNGQQLAFTAVVSFDTPTRTAVFVIDAVGAGERTLDADLATSCCASWSPSGNRLAVRGERPPASGTYVVNADGTCRRLIGEDGWPGAAPWRPGSQEARLICSDLRLVGTASTNLVRRKRPLSYRFELRNLGDMTATGVRLVLHLPGSVAPPVAQTSAGSCLGTHTITCDIGTLAVGRSVVVSASTAPRRVASIATVAEATSDQFDPNAADNRVGLAAQAHDCSLLGTDRPDKLRGTRKRDVACGLAGADWIRTLGSRDFVAAGAGNDVVVSGGGRDTVYGEGGRDRIVVRDGQRDRVACGTDRDVVVADRRDRVARDCEKVVRR